MIHTVPSHIEDDEPEAHPVVVPEPSPGPSPANEKQPPGTPEGLIKAARALMDQLDYVHDHPKYMAVWQLSAIHGFPYDGPQYEKEFDALKAELERIPDVGQGERMNERQWRLIVWFMFEVIYKLNRLSPRYEPGSATKLEYDYTNSSTQW